MSSHSIDYACVCVCVYIDSGSSVRSGSPALSRLVPGHRLWADRHGRHVLGLIEDYSALSKQIREAKRITAAMDKQLQDRVRPHTDSNGHPIARLNYRIEIHTHSLTLQDTIFLPWDALGKFTNNKYMHSQTTAACSKYVNEHGHGHGQDLMTKSNNECLIITTSLSSLFKHLFIYKFPQVILGGKSIYWTGSEHTLRTLNQL